MSNYCVSNAKYLADPEVYKLIFHILSCIEIPIHLYGAWCIVFKTTMTMNSVKYHLLWSHCLSALLDFIFSLISVPYLILPYFAGYALGVLDQPQWELYGSLTVTAIVVTSILCIYENRYYVLYGRNENPLWCRLRKPFLILNYFLAATFISPMYFLVPDQSVALEMLSKSLPCTPESHIADRQIFVAFVDFQLPFLVLVFEPLFLAFQIILFFVITIKKLRKHKDNKSSFKTQTLQKKFTIALSIQLSVPVVLLLLPVSYALVTIKLKYFNQNLSNLCILMTASHGLFSTIGMILIHQPYRDATWNLIMCCKKSKQRASGPHSSAIIKI